MPSRLNCQNRECPNKMAALVQSEYHTPVLLSTSEEPYQKSHPVKAILSTNKLELASSHCVELTTDALIKWSFGNRSVTAL